jgi:hypothetical protein
MDIFTGNEVPEISLERHFLSKIELIKLLHCIDFPGICYSSEVASNRLDDTPRFLRTICEELEAVLINYVPNWASPQELLHVSSRHQTSTMAPLRPNLQASRRMNGRSGAGNANPDILS